MAMDPSPRGRRIEVVFGHPTDIRNRGIEIENLGDQMIGSAGVLAAIADGSDGQQGLSVDKIREVVGEIHVQLRLAGERYRPTGTALGIYGAALESSQTSMRPVVADCQHTWDLYVRARSEYAAANHPLAVPQPAPVPPGVTAPTGPSAAEIQHQQDIDDAHGDMTRAHQDFIGHAQSFDSLYDTWDAAFETAADSIGKATDGGISDGFWDNVDGIVDGVLVVLQYVGIALAILAFIVGGPIIAALGAIVAIVTLVLTLYKAARGHASALEVTLAVVGVIPFGSLAKFAGGAKPGAAAFLNDMVGGLGTTAGRAEIFTAVTDFRSVWGATAPGTSFLSRFAGSVGGSAAMDDIAARIMGFGTGAESAAALTRPTGQGWGIAAHVFGHYGWIVNSPGQLVATGIGMADDIGDGSTVDTWEAELAAS